MIRDNIIEEAEVDLNFNVPNHRNQKEGSHLLQCENFQFPSQCTTNYPLPNNYISFSFVMFFFPAKIQKKTASLLLLCKQTQKKGNNK